MKDVVFEIEFKAWDGRRHDQEYDIEVVNIPIQRVQEQTLQDRRKELRVPFVDFDTLQEQNWKVKQVARDVTLDGTSLGTPHLGQWGVQDKQAIVHEFGHVIGNPDEYWVKSHNIHFGGHERRDYNKPAFSTDSIMNDSRKGRVFRRHFAVVVRLYREWKAATGHRPGVAVIDPAR